MKPHYVEKVSTWIRKNKFTCVPLNYCLEMELKVEIFKFHLSKQAKDELETLREEIAMMRKENF